MGLIMNGLIENINECNRISITCSNYTYNEQSKLLYYIVFNNFPKKDLNEIINNNLYLIYRNMWEVKLKNVNSFLLLLEKDRSSYLMRTSDLYMGVDGNSVKILKSRYSNNTGLVFNVNDLASYMRSVKLNKIINKINIE